MSGKASGSIRGYNGEVEFRLREARREDFETLWKIDQECFPDGIAYSRMELALYMRRSGSFTLVAESTVGKPGRRASEPLPVLGFIVAEAEKQGVGHIITIDVPSKARRAGVGSSLLSSAEDHLRHSGCRTVYLETAVDNVAALAFYKRHGYFLEKTVPGYYANGLDAFLLRKELLSTPEAR